MGTVSSNFGEMLDTGLRKVWMDYLTEPNNWYLQEPTRDFVVPVRTGLEAVIDEEVERLNG